MQLEEHLRDAIRGELQRQAEASGGKLTVTPLEEAVLEVQGPVDVDALTMVIAGALSGGP
ncbi:MAG TPA: hypothetical protein VKY54_02525 [Kiloniellales bacterium]|jgi:hypothetical protein|nr:hypothetical protein [Kiloniellales bacterium]